MPAGSRGEHYLHILATRSKTGVSIGADGYTAGPVSCVRCADGGLGVVTEERSPTFGGIGRRRYMSQQVSAG